jgi:glycosyltransferase involved in cell wall biosynthesis
MSELTVVVPVWGRYSEKLRACVEDLRRQDLRAEIVVVDNASDVPLPDLPEGVRTLRLEQRVSAGGARNAALPIVTTPYVVFADVDDRLLPGTLSLLAGILRDDPGLVAAASRQLHWNPRTGEKHETRGAPRPVVYRLARFPRLLALCTLRFNVFPVIGGTALRTDVVRASGGFGNANLGEDWELASALAWRGRIGFTRTHGLLYAVEEGSLWHRPHEPEAFEEKYGHFRERLYRDPAVPGWARLTRPLFTALQRRDVRRRFAGGSYHPRPILAASAGRHSIRPGGSGGAPDRV